MEFSEIPKVSKLDIDGWESILLYSDGLIEHENKEEDHFLPRKLVGNPSLIETTSNSLKSYEFEDDLTLLHIKSSSIT